MDHEFSTPDSIRFAYLKRMLRLREYQVVGILQMVRWLEESRNGDLSRTTADELGAYLDWKGDSKELYLALIKSQWLVGRNGALVLHHGGRRIECTWDSDYEGPVRRLDIPAGEWKRLRLAVIERDGLVCAYCERIVNVPHIDHIVPLCAGGKSEMDNLTVACRDCNSEKSGMTIIEWSRKKWAKTQQCLST